MVKNRKLFIVSAIICYTMQTEQINFRASKKLIKDIDIVSGLLKINRSEWIKTRLAEEAHKEKKRLLMELSTLYAKGMITKQSVEEVVGKEIADEMEFIKKKALQSVFRGKKLGKKLRGKLKK